MASYFGEVIEPSTRAIFDDDSSGEDDNSEDAVKKTRELEWCTGKVPKNVGLFVLAEGRLAVGFLQHCILKPEHNKVGEIREVILSGTKPTHFREGKPAPIYEMGADVYVCLCPAIDNEDSNSTSKALIPLLEVAKQIILVTSFSAPSYKCNDPSLDLPPSFMRSLYSASYGTQDVIAPVLEQPNIVTGVAAAVLTWCEIFSVPGCLYVCYSDAEEIDSISADPLVKVFTKILGNTFNMKNLQFRGRGLEPSSNLYM